MTTTYRIRDIRPNPFRDIDNYPIIAEKLEALRASYRNTSVWPTVVARLNADGNPEIAFGHHRVEAARQEFGDDGVMPLNIEPLDDAAMLKMMANENMNEYAASAAVTQETVRQVVLAYADGRIDLDGTGVRANVAETRYAPSFARGDERARSRAHPYNAVTVASFLGWNDDKVKEALGQLEETERGTFAAADFHGLTQAQARAAVEGVRGAERVARARGIDPKPVKLAAARAAIGSAKAGHGHERVREEAAKAIAHVAPTERAAVPHDVAMGLYRDVDRFFRVAVPVGTRTVTRYDLMLEIAANRDAIELMGVGMPLADQIASALEEMAREALRLAADLRREVRTGTEVTA